MTYFTFAAMLLLAVGAVISLYLQLQALQKNAYSLSRYFKWVSNSYTVYLATSAIVYCAITFLVLNNKDLFVLILSVLFLAARLALNILTRKKSTKKLGFTARIKRLYVTAILLLGVCLFGSIFSFYNLFGEISRMLCIVLSVVSPLLMVVVWLITYPIEKALAKRFANKSKSDYTAGDDNSKGAML